MPRLPALLRTPIYKNTSSTARDHLASERTFLAWLRTGLGFVALALALHRFPHPEPLPPVPPGASPRPRPPPGALDADAEDAESHAGRRGSEDHLLTAALLATGLGSITYGSARYFSTLRLLEQGLFKPAFRGPAVLGALVAGLSGVAGMGMVKRDVM